MIFLHEFVLALRPVRSTEETVAEIILLISGSSKDFQDVQQISDFCDICAEMTE